MIKILVVSDSHNDTTLLNKIYLKHQDCTYFIHLGDSQLPSFLLSPFVSVKGNNDYENYPLFRYITTPFGNIYCEHGTNYRFTQQEYVKSKNALIFLHGHTHIHYVKQLDNNTYIANPGSLTRPRDESNGTYLIISLDEKNIKFDFYDSIDLI